MFYYFGSKAKIAKYYPAPRYDVIVEPFAGSAGYACYHRKPNVVLVEKDARVCDLWRRLMAMTPDEIRNIPCPRVGERSSDILVMLRAASEHSLTGNYISVTERMVSRWQHLVNRAAELQPLVKAWTIIEGDYTDAPDVEATWFIDPPYTFMRRGYAHKIANYANLAEWCRERKGQVIVCEQLGATWLPFRPFRQARATNLASKTEVIWVGGNE